MSGILGQRPFRCLGCPGEQFMITFGGKHQPVATCQSCGQSYELWARSAVPVRLVNVDGSFAEEPLPMAMTARRQS